MKTTPKKGRLSDGTKILSMKAYALYNEALDDFRTTRKGFLPLNELRRLGNWLAGGPGQLLDPIDFVFIGCVRGGVAVKDFFSDQLQSSVSEKVASGGYLKPHEVICRESVFNNRPVEEVLLEMKISEESIEPKLLIKQIDRETLDFLVHPDGEMERCGFCDESASKFQPVEAFVIKRANYLDTDLVKERSVEDALFVLKDGERATKGSFVISRRRNERGHGHRLVAIPFHGHYFYVQQDREMMHLKVLDNRFKGHLGKAREAAFTQRQKPTIKDLRSKQSNLELAVSRSAAEKRVSAYDKNRERNSQQDQVSESKVSELFPSSRLAGGLGPVSKD